MNLSKTRLKRGDLSILHNTFWIIMGEKGERLEAYLKLQEIEAEFLGPPKRNVLRLPWAWRLVSEP